MRRVQSVFLKRVDKNWVKCIVVRACYETKFWICRPSCAPLSLLGIPGNLELAGLNHLAGCPVPVVCPRRNEASLQLSSMDGRALARVLATMCRHQIDLIVAVLHPSGPPWPHITSSTGRVNRPGHGLVASPTPKPNDPH